jgi:hypothetical protein
MSTEHEAWLEVNVAPSLLLEEQLLIEVVDPLVHSSLAGELETWFYFWEPELRLRLRWREPASEDRLAGVVEAFLNDRQADGAFKEWFAGAHGERGKVYAGEAEQYGAEIWPLVQKDWMSGSELALAIVKSEVGGPLTQRRDWHWSRRVHLFTNQLYSTKTAREAWLKEIELCLNQAQGYARHAGVQITARDG